MVRMDAASPNFTGTADVVRAVYREFRQDPSAVGTLAILKLARSWYATDTGRRENITLSIQSVYLLAVLISGVLAWRLGGIYRRYAIVCGAILLYFWTMAAI